MQYIAVVSTNDRPRPAGWRKSRNRIFLTPKPYETTALQPTAGARRNDSWKSAHQATSCQKTKLFRPHSGQFDQLKSYLSGENWPICPVQTIISGSVHPVLYHQFGSVIRTSAELWAENWVNRAGDEINHKSKSKHTLMPPKWGWFDQISRGSQTRKSSIRFDILLINNEASITPKHQVV